MNNNNLEGKKIVLICPNFYNYSDEIVLALERQGATVVYIDERPSNSFFFKSFLRLGFNKLLDSSIKKYYIKKIKVLDDDVTDFLIVNPEALNDSIVGLIKSKYRDSKFTLYMWDSIKNKKNIDKLFPLFDQCFSFDPQDVKAKSKLLFMPLFYKEDICESIITKKYDMSFAGSCHSDRLPILKLLESGCSLSTNFYIFSPSYMVTILVYLRNFSKLKVKDLKSLNYKKVPMSDINQIMRKSHVVIDIHHPKQTGLTMRCFEVLAAGVKLITTNQDIRNYDFYNENNILIIERDKIDFDKIKRFINIEFDYSSIDSIHRYKIDNWVKGLLK